MLYCYCVALLLFVLSYVLIVFTVPLPPGVNQLQSTNISIYLKVYKLVFLHYKKLTNFL